MDYDLLVQVFFIITAAAVIVISIALLVIMIYIFSVVRTVKRMAKMAESTANVIKDDVIELRNDLKTKGLKLATLTSFFGKVAKNKVNKK